MKTSKRKSELRKMAITAKMAMLEAIDGTRNDTEYGYVISRIMLSLSHTVCSLLDYEEELEEQNE